MQVPIRVLGFRGVVVFADFGAFEREMSNPNKRGAKGEGEGATLSQGVEGARARVIL